MATQKTVKNVLENVEVSFDGRSVRLPVVRGSEGEAAIDISRLRADLMTIEDLDTAVGRLTAFVDELNSHGL